MMNTPLKMMIRWKGIEAMGKCRRSTAAALAMPDDDFAAKWEAAKPFSHIPGPTTYPILKNLPYQFTGLPCKFEAFAKTFDHLYDTFGPIVKWEVPLFHPIVFVFDNEYVEEVLRKGVSSQPVRDILHYMKTYRTQTRKEWFGENGGILLESGEKWYEIRSKVQQSMMRPKTAADYVESMDEVATDFILKIKQLRDAKQEVPQDFQNELFKWALESVALVALNTRLGCLKQHDSYGQEMISTINESMALMGKLEFNFPMWKYFPTKTWKQFVAAMDTMSQTGIKHINEAKEKLEKKRLDEIDIDDLSVLEKFLLTPGLSKEHAYTMALDMLFAGTDTTGSQMGFFLYLLAKNPNIQKKIQVEIDSALPHPNKPVTAKSLNSLPYLKASLKEAMRMMPAASGFGRNLEQDLVLGGYRVPKDTLIMNAMITIFKNEKYYPEPMKFIPERWIRGDPQQTKTSPFNYLPFGHGARMCIGRRLAEHEMWILTTKILQNFSVQYHHEDIGIYSRMINTADKPLKFRFIDRKI